MWMTMFKKDIRALSTSWFVTLGVLIVIVLAIGGASALGYAAPGAALAIAGFLVLANVFLLPAQLFRSLKSELRRTPSLWLLTPTSGWSMLWSKLLSSLVGAVLCAIVTYLLSIILSSPITGGTIVFDAIVMVIVFYLTGRLIHRHVEV